MVKDDYEEDFDNEEYDEDEDFEDDDKVADRNKKKVPVKPLPEADEDEAEEREDIKQEVRGRGRPRKELNTSHPLPAKPLPKNNTAFSAIHSPETFAIRNDRTGEVIAQESTLLNLIAANLAEILTRLQRLEDGLL